MLFVPNPRLLIIWHDFYPSFFVCVTHYVVHKLTEAQKGEHNGVRMAADYSNNRRYSATDSKPGKNHQDNDESTRLERTLGLMSGVTLIIGTMIGKHIIYLLPDASY